MPLTTIEHRTSTNNRAPHRVLARDDKGNVCALVYFGKASYTAKKLFPPGEKRWVAGKLEQYDQWLQIVHPEHVADTSAGLMGHLVEPVYPLAEGLTQPRIASLVQQAGYKLGFTAVSGPNGPGSDRFQLLRYNVEPYSARTFELVLEGACDALSVKDTVPGTHARRALSRALGLASR